MATAICRPGHSAELCMGRRGRVPTGGLYEPFEPPFVIRGCVIVNLLERSYISLCRYLVIIFSDDEDYMFEVKLYVMGTFSIFDIKKLGST